MTLRCADAAARGLPTRRRRRGAGGTAHRAHRAPTSSGGGTPARHRGDRGGLPAAPGGSTVRKSGDRDARRDTRRTNRSVGAPPPKNAGVGPPWRHPPKKAGSGAAATAGSAGFLVRADDSSSDWDERDEDDRSSASDASASWAIAWRAVHDDSDDPRGETFIKCLQGGEINLCVADQHQGRQLGRLPGPW